MAKHRLSTGRAGALPALLTLQLGPAMNPRRTDISTNGTCRWWGEGGHPLWPEDAAEVVPAGARGSRIRCWILSCQGRCKHTNPRNAAGATWPFNVHALGSACTGGEARAALQRRGRAAEGLHGPTARPVFFTEKSHWSIFGQPNTFPGQR